MHSFLRLGIVAVVALAVASCGKTASTGSPSAPSRPLSTSSTTVARIPGVPEGVLQYGLLTVTVPPRRLHATVSEAEAEKLASSIISSRGLTSQLEYKGAALAELTNRSVTPSTSGFDWLLIYFSSDGFEAGQGCAPSFCLHPYHYFSVAVSATSDTVDNTYTGVIPINNPSP